MTAEQADPTAAHARAALRLAVSPRYLLVLVGLMVLVVGAALLGRWQWDRTQDILAAERAAVAEPVDVREALAENREEVPAESIGRPVTASGSYRPGLQAVVSSRSLDGRPGVWVVTGLEQDDGSVVTVLRGWVPDAADPSTAVPEVPVRVAGILQPDEGFYEGAVASDGSVAAISHSTLSRLWKVPVLPGFIVLSSQQPQVARAPSPVPPTVRTADIPFPLRNFSYAFQWWIFALFGLVVYVRWVWVDSRPPSPTGA